MLLYSLYSIYICLDHTPLTLRLEERQSQRLISKINCTSRGSAGVREHHRVNEEKILAHRRSGYTDNDIDELLQQS